MRPCANFRPRQCAFQAIVLVDALLRALQVAHDLRAELTRHVEEAIRIFLQLGKGCDLERAEGVKSGTWPASASADCTYGRRDKR